MSSCGLIVVAVLCAGLLVYGAYVGSFIFRAIAIDARLKKSTVRYEQHPASATTRILVAGDSTAVGLGASNLSLTTAGRLGQVYPDADLTNLSENGLKIAGLTEKLQALPEKSFGLALIQIGANDVIRFVPLEEVRQNLRKMLASVTTRAGRVVLLTSGNIGLAPIFKWPLSQIYTKRTREVRTIFMEEAGAHPSVSFVDLFKEAEYDTLRTDISRYYASDLLHLSNDGYGVWFEEIQKVLLNKTRI